MSRYDFIIVGAGTGGSVFANRLSASGSARVLLIESGDDVKPGAEPADIRNVFPLSSFNPKYMWADTKVYWGQEGASAPQFLQQGRILGGGSALMGMWALRGTPADYDGWRSSGARNWGWSDVLPYFNRLEQDVDFAGPSHGNCGPIPIRRELEKEWSPLAIAIKIAAQRRGFSHIDDPNADFSDAHCTLPVSRYERSRASAGICYLTESVRRRPNLRVVTGCTVSRLVVSNRKVIGVISRHRDGREEQFHAASTIVTAGALRSPALLMRSGLGPASELQAVGVSPLCDLPGVGRNLQNHCILFAVAMLERGAVDAAGSKPAGSTFLRWSSGLPGTPTSDMALFVRNYLSWHALGRRMASLAPCLMRPASTGYVKLGTDPEGPPRIAFNFLSDERDLTRLKGGMRFAAALLAEPEVASLARDPVVLRRPSGLFRYNTPSRMNALRGWVAAHLVSAAPRLGQGVLRSAAEMVPLDQLVNDDDALIQYIRNGVAGTAHVCGTCKIGSKEDSFAVVDDKGAVYGVGGLWIGDASVMPFVPSAGTHIPTVMVAEKIAATLAFG